MKLDLWKKNVSEDEVELKILLSYKEFTKQNGRKVFNDQHVIRRDCKRFILGVHIGNDEEVFSYRDERQMSPRSYLRVSVSVIRCEGGKMITVQKNLTPYKMIRHNRVHPPTSVTYEGSFEL